jgi:hypothetical protein
MSRIKIHGILIIYHHYLMPNASMIMEHVNAFQKCSKFKVWIVNVELGFPGTLEDLEFDVIILHYSLFAWLPFYLDEAFETYLAGCTSSYKIAFFQDEYRFWPERAALLNRYQVDCVYTCLEPTHFAATYQRFTRVPKLLQYLPGYISEEMVRLGRHYTTPDAQRPIDIGYRGRQADFSMGKGAQEKHVIGVRFWELAAHLSLQLDIETDESKRIYGADWLAFLANCRAVLGVEAGVSIFDIDNVVLPRCRQLLAENPHMTFEEMYDTLLVHYEDQGVYYRTVSPRVFEAAAVRTCQILFEGKYSGVLEPMVHYIPLQKDFGNFDEVMHLYYNAALRRELTENAYRDLIASGRYSYRKFIADFDQQLLALGLSPAIDPADTMAVTWRLTSHRMHRTLQTKLKQADDRFRHRFRQKKHQLVQSLVGSQSPTLRRLKASVRFVKHYWQ